MADESEGDEELAPLVDGLSGALCILVLISTVFLLSSSDLFIESEGEGLKLRDSYVVMNKNTINYYASISLSAADLYQVRKKMIDSKSKKIILYGAMSDAIENGKEKNTYNLLKFYADLKLPSGVEVNFKAGDAALCEESLSCIYWGFN